MNQSGITELENNNKHPFSHHQIIPFPLTSKAGQKLRRRKRPQQLKAVFLPKRTIKYKETQEQIVLKIILVSLISKPKQHNCFQPIIKHYSVGIIYPQQESVQIKIRGIRARTFPS